MCVTEQPEPISYGGASVDTTPKRFVMDKKQNAAPSADGSKLGKRADDLIEVALDDSALDQVSGGITVTKRTDTASADLFLKCANGRHYDSI
jgi:hypothetical protein